MKKLGKRRSSRKASCPTKKGATRGKSASSLSRCAASTRRVSALGETAAASCTPASSTRETTPCSRSPSPSYPARNRSSRWSRKVNHLIKGGSKDPNPCERIINDPKIEHSMYCRRQRRPPRMAVTVRRTGTRTKPRRRPPPRSLPRVHPGRRLRGSAG